MHPKNFVHYRALGRAILDAYGASIVRHLTSPNYKVANDPERSVVIIDEIDKAPRDFPNDLLNEIEHLWFRVSELEGFLGPDAEPLLVAETPRDELAGTQRPIIVITSNLERQLPDAFLRRCVFHHIEFPSDETQREIVANHLIAYEKRINEAELRELLNVVRWARNGNLSRAPGLAEVITFATAFFSDEIHKVGNSLGERLARCAGSLAKSESDVSALRSYVSPSLSDRR